MIEKKRSSFLQETVKRKYFLPKLESTWKKLNSDFEQLLLTLFQERMMSSLKTLFTMKVIFFMYVDSTYGSWFLDLSYDKILL